MGKASRRKEQRVPTAPHSETVAQPIARISSRPLAAALALSFFAVLIYSNTFTSSFHFDDIPNIVENPRIKDLSNFSDWSGRRVVGFLSFALNYGFRGLEVSGYHLVNLLIHISNGVLIYCFVLLLFNTPHQDARAPAGSWIAFGTALLFVIHPIQTQAVTYIVQRLTSLATMFYLLTLVCYIRWRLISPNNKRPLWYAGAYLSAILAVKTKEISSTLPLMLLLVEALFFRPISKRSLVPLLPFFLIPFIIPLSTPELVGQGEAGLARQTTQIGRQPYLFTQFRVIVTYLRLLFFPVNQNLDHDYPVYHSLLDPPVFFSFLLLSSLVFLALYLFPRSTRSNGARPISFGILWFFLALSVESSIIPIQDVINEHRLYLPSIGFFLALSTFALAGLEWLRRRGRNPAWIISGFTCAIVLLSAATYYRNMVWREDLTLWQDVVKKSPRKARAHLTLGATYEKRGNEEAAIQAYQTALRLQPDYPEAHYNLGALYAREGQQEKAIEAYQNALKFGPIFFKAYNALGNIYAVQGKWQEAIERYQAALRISPDYAEAHTNLGNAYKAQGRLDDAIKEYQSAVKFQPDDTMTARNNLGALYASQGKWGEAVQELKRAIQENPRYALAHRNLGAVYAAQGRIEEAIHEYRIALEIQPDYAEAYYNLGNAYVNQGRLDEAARQYQRALQLKPDYAEAHNNLGNAYRQQGRLAEAREEFQTALRITPDYPAARQALESLPR